MELLEQFKAITDTKQRVKRKLKQYEEEFFQRTGRYVTNGTIHTVMLALLAARLSFNSSLYGSAYAVPFLPMTITLLISLLWLFRRVEKEDRGALLQDYEEYKVCDLL